jgi:hypothetical protein
MIGQRRIPGLKIHDDRVIRLLETHCVPRLLPRLDHSQAAHRRRQPPSARRLRLLSQPTPLRPGQTPRQGFGRTLGHQATLPTQVAGPQTWRAPGQVANPSVGSTGNPYCQRQRTSPAQPSSSVDAAFARSTPLWTISQQLSVSNTQREQIFTQSLAKPYPRAVGRRVD